MPAFLTSLGAKLGVAAALLLLAFGLGSYAGYRWAEPQIAAAKLALAQQQAADAQAVAASNAQAVVEMQTMQGASDAALAARQGRVTAAQGQSSAARAAIAAQAGQDAPIAPVLAAALKAIQ
jgi:hypothetical protein